MKKFCENVPHVGESLRHFKTNFRKICIGYGDSKHGKMIVLYTTGLRKAVWRNSSLYELNELFPVTTIIKLLGFSTFLT